MNLFFGLELSLETQGLIVGRNEAKKAAKSVANESLQKRSCKLSFATDFAAFFASLRLNYQP